MVDPNLVISGLSQRTTIGGAEVRIEIYKLEDEANWILEIVNEEGVSIVWDEPFLTDTAAIDEATRILKNKGLSVFRDNGNIVRFPKR